MSNDMATLRELCAKMKDLQTRKDAVDAEGTRLTAELDELRLRKIPELMEALEVRNATFEGIGRVQLASDLYCSTRAGEKEVAMQWLRDCGQEGMITESYNASSMKAYVRRLIEQGAEIPQFLNVQPFVRASIVKA